jgi:N-acetylmuramoyl-L-alanine amidase
LAPAAEAVQKRLEAGAIIGIKGGRTLYLEVQLPKGSAKAEVLKRYLANENAWTQFQKLKTAYLHFRDLKPAVQRRVMETIFPEDYSDKTGWWHKVTYEGAAGVESWWNLAEWLTGKGTNYKVLEAMPENQGYKGTLRKGQMLLVPRDLLTEAFKTPTAGLPGKTGVLLEPMDVEEDLAPYRPLLPGELTYGKDGKGEYAAYAMKKGEAIYTSVVIRFTDYREVIAVQEAAAEVLKRNGIEDPTRIHVDQEIRIPRDMLADEYQPEGSAQRLAHEGVSADAKRFRAARGGVKNLDGVVVILDAGHGGCDHGAFHGTLYEDELTYDIVNRIRKVMESTTRARVHTTVKDLSQKDQVTDIKAFKHDTDEVVLTNPPYNPQDTSVSANLRWYVANSIYREELKKGIKPENMLFASIHCDALYYKLRGSMVYIPGAAHRLSSKALDGPAYAAYTKEGNRSASSTADERRRDEALSRDFAETLLKSLSAHKPAIAVHTNSDPIRNVIQRSRTERWLPAVLKHTLVPTKVLVETANLQNPDDRKCLADPVWRQAYAEAFVNAVERHFGK